MEFTPITPEEFYQKSQYNRGAGTSPFNKAIIALEVGGGFSTQCIWNHTGTTSSCAGIGSAHGISKRQHKNRTIQGSCKDGTLYILRIEDKRA